MARHSTTDSYSYSIRVSKRAKRARLQIKPYQGLEVVIPRNFPEKRIIRFLLQHEDWIKQKLSTNCYQQKPEYPQSITLSLLQSQWPIHYQQCDKPGVKESDSQLILNYKQQNQIGSLLRQWLRQKAKQQLPQMLSDRARELGMTYQKISIRSQKTRWGSCSSKATISLNDQLLFLPIELVDYILIHELCHIKHLNHSANFWLMVERFCPGYRFFENQLKQARNFIPEWFLYELLI